jgi:pimeloyl-ACP methyl ester carboxylesterase
MIERSHVFGKDHRLVGICTEPSLKDRKPQAPAFLLLNAGIIHRVGPFRFYVDLARLLAKKGFTTLRFDLSGIGDSLPGKGNRPEHDRVMGDIADAMDLLEVKKGIHKFVLSGLCWGADMSHDCAVLDSRVAGAVMLDTYGYPTFGFFMRDRVFPLLNLTKWSNLIRKKIIAFKQGATRPKKKKGPGVFNRQFPAKAKAVADIEHLISRNARLLYIYSGGVPEYYNYGNQFWDMFKGLDFCGCVESVYFKDADHIFSNIQIRRRMFDSIIQWMEKNFPGDDDTVKR